MLTPGPASCPRQVCITALGWCTDNPLSGVAVTIMGPGPYGATYGPVTTGYDGEACITLPACIPGGEFTVVGVWNGIQTVSKQIQVQACGKTVNTIRFVDNPIVGVKGCSGPGIAGAIVTWGGATCTTDGNGFCTLDFSHADPGEPPYPVTAQLPTGPRRTENAGYGLNGGGLCLTGFQFIDQFCVTVAGCGKAVAGATVSVSTDVGDSFTGTTDDNGMVCFIPTVDWQTATARIVVSKPPYWATTITTQGPYPGCSSAVPLSPIPCYSCCGACDDPFPSQIQITDANGGHGATMVSNGGVCVAAVCYIAPLPPALQWNGNSCAVAWFFQMNPDGTASAQLHWPVRQILGVNQIDSSITCDQVLRGQLTPPGFIDSVQVNFPPDCTGPYSFTGAIPPAGSFTTTPVSGNVTVSDNCSTRPIDQGGAGGSFYYYYEPPQTLPDVVLVIFDASGFWGALAGKTIEIPFNALSGDYEASCLQTITDGGNCDPTGDTEAVMTVSLSLIAPCVAGGSPGSVDAVVQWTGGTAGPGCADGACEYYGSTSGNSLPMGAVQNTLNMDLMSYLSGGSGTFVPPGDGTISQSFTTPGTFSWTAPPGVTSVEVECYGGGGAGNFSTTGGGGGGGGAYARSNALPVTPGNVYTVTVGTGSSGGGGGGGTSSFAFGLTTFTDAAGGSDATFGNPAGAAGGGGGFGDVSFSGGNGGNGTTTGINLYGGGGGGSGGPTAPGGNGSNATGGTPGSGGPSGGGSGDGGGGGSPSGAGTNGQPPGGGGGGAGNSSAGNGAPGAVILTWIGGASFKLEVPCP